MSELSKAEMLQSFTRAVASWARAGFKVVTEEEFVERLAICEACEFWDGKARGGLGKCGCSSPKLIMASEKCPIDKWGPTL